jgi:gentisate 1,2-dioxygenase
MNQKAADPRDLQIGRSNVKDNKELIEFYKELEDLSTTAFWRRANDIEPWEPVSRYKSTLWKYSDLRDLVLKSADLVTPEEAGRRVIVLMNDSDAGRENTACVGWLFSGLQVMKPGEITPAHKHTASAQRFIMEGGGAYTVVDGHQVSLNKNDYVLTPNGCWHDHGVFEDGEVCIWQDGLDIPLMNSLETNFYAVYPEKTQDRQFNLDDSPNSYGGPGLIPVEREPWDKPYSPLLVYRWKDTKDALYNLSKSGEGSPFDGYILRYSNPVTGGWAMSTMGAHMQMLNPNHHTKAHRHTGNVMYNCAGGEGYSVIGGKKYNWKEHDIFCVPSWTWHEHVNTSKSEEAFLYSFNDFPVMESLGVFKEEVYKENNGYQQEK